MNLHTSSVAAMHSRATSLRSKCGHKFDLQFRQKRTQDVLPHPATLVTSPV